MIYRNALIENSTEPSDLRIRDGVFTEIGKALVPEEGEEVHDLGRHLVLPPFIESHVHLDT